LRGALPGGPAIEKGAAPPPPRLRQTRCRADARCADDKVPALQARRIPAQSAARSARSRGATVVRPTKARIPTSSGRSHTDQADQRQPSEPGEPPAHQRAPRVETRRERSELVGRAKVKKNTIRQWAHDCSQTGIVPPTRTRTQPRDDLVGRHFDRASGAIATAAAEPLPDP